MACAYLPVVRALALSATYGRRWIWIDAGEPSSVQGLLWNTGTGPVGPYLFEARNDTMKCRLGTLPPTRYSGLGYYLALVPQPPRFSRGRLLNLRGTAAGPANRTGVRWGSPPRGTD